VLEPETQNIKLGLDRVQKVLERMGDPQQKFPAVHVAGTNGKGSVCAMLDSILREAGYKVGLYTSPHLFKLNERVRIQGDDISDERLEEGIRRVKKAAEGIELTTFEILTCMAFDYFAEQKIDIAVVEVGLGGRLDATNLVLPLVSVITNVEMDHTDHLGDTLEKIAYEKAGIIKEGIPCVTSENKPEILELIKGICIEKKATFYMILRSRVRIPILHLRGPHQRVNAILVSEVIWILKKKGFSVGDDQIRQGIEKTRWRGRMDIVSHEPLVILDGAHNPAGAKVLVEALREMKIKRPVTFIFGAQIYKEWLQMLEILIPVASKLIITRSSHPQAADPKAIEDELLHFKAPKEVTANPSQALSEALKDKDSAVVVAGSLFLVADILKMYPQNS